jgi:hypothetical protein
MGQGSELARLVLYYLNHSSSPKFLFTEIFNFYMQEGLFVYTEVSAVCF